MAERYRTPEAVMRETATPETMWGANSGVGCRRCDSIEREGTCQSINSTTIRSARWICRRRRGSTRRSWGSRVGFRPPFKFPGLWLYNGGSYPDTFGVVHIIGIDPNDPSGLKEYLGDRDLTSLNGTGTVDHMAFRATGLSRHARQAAGA